MATLPRRWNVELDGIRWLPRMIDKARMSEAGTLGTYLIGHSPIDRALLTRLGITTEQFIRIVASESNDAGVLAALRSQPGYDDARVRRWSDRFDRTYRILIRLWDVDEGYVQANPFERAVLALYRIIERPMSAFFRTFSPAP
jgi:hypothetical protein